jgi:hypothetical protein
MIDESTIRDNSRLKLEEFIDLNNEINMLKEEDFNI